MDKKYGNKYEVACAILEKLEQGGSGTGGGKFTLVDGIKLGNSTFTEVPENLDFSEVTDFRKMFYECHNLTTVEALDTSKGTNFYGMFVYCDNLTTVGNLDTSKGTNFSAMFNYCKNLTTVGNLDTSKGTDFGNMFNACANITSIPQLDTSKGWLFNEMFSGCNRLTTIPSLNLSKGTSINYMFSRCGALENISFVGYINYNIDFSYSTLLTYDSIKSILTACSNTTSTSSKTLKFSRTIADNNGELATLVGECTTKGWTITGLTLE